MAVSRDEVLRVAALARLQLTDDEVDSLAQDLADILAHVAELRTSSVEHRTSNIELPTSHGELPAAGAVPADGEASGGDPLSGGVEGIAPDFQDGFFRVPRLGSHEGADSGTDSGSHKHGEPH